MPQFTKIIGILAIAGTLLLNSSCKEEELLQTTDIPAVDNINTFFTDTNTVIANNAIRDSFQTGGDSSKIRLINNYPGLGCISNDPVFGSTVASMVFQVVPPKNLLKFPTTGTLVRDSVILSVPFRSMYGDTSVSNIQTFNLYRLVDTLSKGVKFYNTTEVNYEPTLLGSATINLSKMDSIVIGGKKREPQMRIALSADFADKLFALTDTIEYKNAETFQRWLKGFYLAPADTNSGAAIGHFFLPNITMTYYFRNTIGSITDTTQFVFKYDQEKCSHFNRITRNYAKSAANGVKAFLNTGNIAGDSKLFAQGDFGSVIEVKLPYIHKLDNVLINKAELEFTVIPSGYPSADTAFKNVLRLFPWKINENAAESIFYSQASPNLSENTLKEVSVNGVSKKRYLISINSLVQKAVTLKDTSIYLRIRGLNLVSDIRARQGDGRVVLGGSNASTDRVKLNLIYTKIK
jgi:hypothetical protein